MKIQFDCKKIEKKWRLEWEKKKLYSPDIKGARNPFYNLWMFPYPSAEGLHAGHAFASTGSDVYGRFMRMLGKDVFQPIGYDSFGIHSENYAIKINQNPHEVVKRTTKHYEEQMRALGHGYDWTHTVTTSSPDYYRWTQWLFLRVYGAGLAYKKKATVNFCSSCKTVLADEQVMSPAQAGKEARNANGEVVRDGEELKVCERCGTIVEKKDLEQWFFRITDYADRLLEGLRRIDWSERVITAQRNWIGKSEGMIINFKTEDGEDLPVFTTRPDTLNAATFIVRSDDELYNKKTPKKIGKFTGKYAIDPLSKKRLPIWKTNYVASGYGTGNVMGVPAHDERDMEFARKYHLDIIQKKPDESLWRKIEEEGWGKKHISYHLRDWLVSRQRYWGAPIPMIYCTKDGWVPVPEKDLPVLLPNISDYKPEGTGKGPLANHKEFYETTCPKCGGKATRETDVMDTFVDSSWYFLRYPSAGDNKSAFDPIITKKWLPVNLYFGGAEHSVLHLMYARFVTKVLYDLKLIDFDEPFPKFFAHGLMIKEGAKMSKSRGNVVNPDAYIEKFGADAFRLYLLFIGPMDTSPDFRDTGIEGMTRFVGRVWRLYQDYKDVVLTDEEDSRETLVKMHQTIKKVTEDIENFRYNTAISAIMEFVNLLYEKAQADDRLPADLTDLAAFGESLRCDGSPSSPSGAVSRTNASKEGTRQSASLHRTDVRCAEWDEALRTLCLLLAPFAPHMAEEIWQTVLNQSKVGQKSVNGQKTDFNFIHLQPWPKFDADLAREKENVIVVQIDGKLRSSLTVSSQQSKSKEEIENIARRDAKVTKWLKGKKLKNTIFVPGKLINFVVK